MKAQQIFQEMALSESQKILAALWEEHMRHEFTTQNIEDTLLGLLLSARIQLNLHLRGIIVLEPKQ